MDALNTVPKLPGYQYLGKVWLLAWLCRYDSFWFFYLHAHILIIHAIMLLSKDNNWFSVLAIDANFDIYFRPGDFVEILNPTTSPNWSGQKFTISSWIRPDRVVDDNGVYIDIIHLTVDGSVHTMNRA